MQLVLTVFDVNHFLITETQITRRLNMYLLAFQFLGQICQLCDDSSRSSRSSRVRTSCRRSSSFFISPCILLFALVLRSLLCSICRFSKSDFIIELPQVLLSTHIFATGERTQRTWTPEISTFSFVANSSMSRFSVEFRTASALTGLIHLHHLPLS